MTEVSWSHAGGADWLVAARPWQPGQPEAVGGVTFEAGLLHEPAELLGVTSLLAAWLVEDLTRPVEAVDSPDTGPVQVFVELALLDSSLMVVGSTAAVAAALRRVDQLLDDVPPIEVDDDLRGRARLHYRNPLTPWRAHLATRWPGHRPHLPALGPLALASLDAAALRAFAAERLRPARRVYWTDAPGLPELVCTGAQRAVPPMPPPVGDPVTPAGWRQAPGCVRQRGEAELLSVAAPATPAATLALSLLHRSLHRRLIELEPLASAVQLTPHRLSTTVVIAAGEADLLPDKAASARAAVVQTLEDLAAGGLPQGEIEQVRAAYVDNARTLPPYQPRAMLDLARRQLRHGDRPTPDRRVAEYAEVSDEQVRAALAELHPQLLLAVPAGEEPPLPMAEPVEPRPAEGRRFHHWTQPGRWLRCSPRRLGLAGRVSARRSATVASVDFDEVVLRLDTGDQATTLVDRYWGAVTVEWDLYRRGRQLRALVDRHTAGVPVIRQLPDPTWTQRVAPALKRGRRRLAIGIAGYVIGGLGVLGVILGAVLDRPEQPDEPAPAETVDAATPVTLSDGTTLEIAEGPELIEHYVPERPYTYAVQVRMCAGEQPFGNFFSSTSFRLDIAGQPQSSFQGIAERPGPPAATLDEGQCATGWLLYQLTGPTLPAPPVLHYFDESGDRAAWQLTQHPARSPLDDP